MKAMHKTQIIITLSKISVKGNGTLYENSLASKLQYI